MATLLENLLIVQDRDHKLSKLERETKDIPKRKADIDSRLNAQRASLQKANDELMTKTAAMKDVEGEIESIKEKIIKYREQQFQIKSNEEYRALENEIATAEKKISDLETKELVMMDALDEAKSKIKEIEEGMKVDEDRVADDMALLDRRAEKLQKEIEELKAGRDALLVDVAEEFLSRYERIMNHVQGNAMVPIQNGACGGCHMKLPPQVVNDAKKANEQTFCSYCGRIVYRND